MSNLSVNAHVKTHSPSLSALTALEFQLSNCDTTLNEAAPEDTYTFGFKKRMFCLVFRLDRKPVDEEFLIHSKSSPLSLSSIRSKNFRRRMRELVRLRMFIELC